MIDHENFKGLSEQSETTMGASTRIFKQLNSKAIMGFNNITDMLKQLFINDFPTFTFIVLHLTCIHEFHC